MAEIERLVVAEGKDDNSFWLGSDGKAITLTPDEFEHDEQSEIPGTEPEMPHYSIRVAATTLKGEICYPEMRALLIFFMRNFPALIADIVHNVGTKQFREHLAARGLRLSMDTGGNNDQT